MLTVVRTFTMLPEAEVAVSYLDAHGIAATVFDRHILSAFPDAYFAIGGFRVAVPEEDAPTAGDLLSNLIPLETPEADQEPPVDRSGGGRLATAVGALWGLFAGLPFAPQPRRPR